MLEEILENLKNFSQIQCFEINHRVYQYKDLYKYVCNIYEYIQSKNEDRQPIVVYGHKDIFMIASFLACSFAGITYVPIDESMPHNRMREILNQVNPKLIIDKSIESIMEKEDFKDIEEVLLKPNDIYYIIFTSGSTGKPKGVKVTYENVQSCVEWVKKIGNIENGIILNQANFSFDLSVADIYLSLVTKSKLFIIERKVQKDYRLLFETLRESKANLAVMTPSFADLLLVDKSFGKELMPYLKHILFCGEKLTHNTIRKLYERFGSIDITNCYGPTECTFAVTSIDISPKTFLQEEISIGYPKEDVRIYIVNDKLDILQDDEVGEIMITGKSVAEGYVHEDTKRNGFLKFNGEKAYLTGDLGYFHNGKLYYKCRKDNQIKYKGYRIELEDIEKTINALEYVEKVFVTTLKNNEDKVSKIIAFVKLREGSNHSGTQIRDDVHKLLPDYMCPTIKIVEEVPLNQNGKADYKKLLEEYQNGR